MQTGYYEHARDKHSGHRVLDGISTLIRIGAGIILLMCVASSDQVITLILRQHSVTLVSA